jgi:hypothetical protein
MGSLEGWERKGLVVALFVGQRPAFYGKSKKSSQQAPHSVGEDGGRQTCMLIARDGSDFHLPIVRGNACPYWKYHSVSRAADCGARIKELWQRNLWEDQ